MLAPWLSPTLTRLLRCVLVVVLLPACGSGVEGIVFDKSRIGPDGSASRDASDDASGLGSLRPDACEGTGEGGTLCTTPIGADGGHEPDVIRDGVSPEDGAAEGGTDRSSPISPDASVECPKGFLEPSATWAVREGDLASKQVLRFENGGLGMDGWAFDASTAPSWVRVTVSREEAAIAIDGFNRVPYQAYPGTAFSIGAAFGADGICPSRVDVMLDVTNRLRAKDVAPGMPKGVAAAAYQPERNRFVMLDAANATLYFLENGDPPRASDGIVLPKGDVADAVAPSIAVTSGHVLVVRGSRLWFLDANGAPDGALGTGADAASIEIGATAPNGVRSLAAAGGYIVVGDTQGPTVVVREETRQKLGSEAGVKLPNKVSTVSSDGVSFAYVAPDANDTNVWDVWHVAPPSFSGWHCGLSSQPGAPSVAGQNVAVMTRIAGVSQSLWLLDEPHCAPSRPSPPSPISLGDGGSISLAAGIAGSYALTVLDARDLGAGLVMDVALYDWKNGVRVGDIFKAPGVVSMSPPSTIVVGGRQALIVTSQPLLIDL